VVVVTHSFRKCGGRDAFVPEVWWSWRIRSGSKPCVQV